MTKNNTLLTISTVALVFTVNAEAANSDILHNDNPVSVVQTQIQALKQQSVFTIAGDCIPGDRRPECQPNDDFVCIAA